MSDQKQIYRQEAIRHRERMDIRDEDPDMAADNFMKAIQPDESQSIGIYWPKGRELDTSPLIEQLFEANIGVALPIIQKGSRLLSFAKWTEKEPLQKGLYDIMQPVLSEETQFIQPDIVVVPMLAFDRRGHRLGYGGGYFDCTLENLKLQKNVLAVGYAYSQQAVLFNLPTEIHDQQLDWIITPKEVHSFVRDDNNVL